MNQKLNSKCSIFLITGGGKKTCHAKREMKNNIKETKLPNVEHS